MTYVLAVASHKGGTGKTTTAVNLAADAAARGLRVLAVDVDPQGALSAALNVDASPPTIYDLLEGGDLDPLEAVRQVQRQVGDEAVPIDRLEVVPTDISLAGAGLELPRRAGWHTILRDTLADLQAARRERAEDGWDLIVIDTAPGLEVLPYIALAASHGVIVTMETEYLALRALDGLIETLKTVRKVNPELRVLGIVPTMVGRARHHQQVLERLQADQPQLLLPPVPRRVALADATIAGEPILTYSPSGDAAQAYSAVTQEVLSRAGITPP